MDKIIAILYLVSPIVFFIGIFNLYIKRENLKANIIIFILNFTLLIYLLIKSYKRPYIILYYGILGIVAFVFAVRGIINYYSNKNLTKEQKINFLIYLFICLIIGFGMCYTTGIFGF